MDVYASDKEQAELLKELWNKYGKALVAGVVFALIISFAWRWWQGYRTEKAEQASVIYEQILTELSAGKEDVATPLIKQLKTQYTKTPYAAAAELLMAKQAVYRQKFDEAQTHLQWVVDHSNSISLRQVARLRLARLMLTNHETTPALEVLKTVDDKAYQPEIDAVKGDVFAVLKQFADARASYQAALDALKNEESDMRAILQMKLADLPV